MLGGAALIGQSWGFAPHRLIGDLYGLITAIFFGSYMLAIRSARATLGAGQLAFISTAITTVILFVIAAVLEPRLLPQSMNGALVLLALALVSQVGGQGLLAVALGTLPATFSSLVIFLEAVAAAALAWAVLGEALGVLQMLGGLLILAGIYMARPRQTAKDARGRSDLVSIEPKQFLESLFEKAIAAAHPSVCLPPLLPEPPASGRLILLAAGKAAGSMIETAERHYLEAKRVPRERLVGHRGRAPRLWTADASRST